MKVSMTPRSDLLKNTTARQRRRLYQSEDDMADDNRRKMDAAEGLLKLGKESIIFTDNYDRKLHIQDPQNLSHQEQLLIARHHQQVGNRERATQRELPLCRGAGTREVVHSSLRQSPYISDSRSLQSPAFDTFNQQSSLSNRTFLSTVLQLSTLPQHAFPDPTVQPCAHVLHYQQFCVKELCNHACCIAFRSCLAAQGTSTSDYLAHRDSKNTSTVIKTQPGEDVLQSIEAHFAAEKASAKAAEEALNMPFAREQLTRLQNPVPIRPSFPTADPLQLPPYPRPMLQPSNHQVGMFGKVRSQPNLTHGALGTPQPVESYSIRKAKQVHLTNQTLAPVNSLDKQENGD